MEYAICFVPNNPLRVDHDECSEMLTELLFGEACTVTESWGNWSKIINKAEGYVGWVPQKCLLPLVRRNLMPMILLRKE